MTRYIVFSIILILSICATTVGAQNENDLYLFSLERTGKGEYHLHSPKFLNSFNRGGYNNQPSFTPSGDLLISVRKQGETQNDIWLLSLNSKKYKRLTRTSAFEYSPRIHPDEEQLTVLRKVGETPLDQQVCNIHLRTGDMHCLTPSIKDIGYYTWLSEKELGLWRIENNTNRLSYYNTEDGKSRRITTSIGRTLHSDKNGSLYYVHKFTDEFWYIKKYNPSTSAIDIITQTIGKNEDFAMTAEGTIFMGKDNILYSFHPGAKEWTKVADLSIYGIKFISRLAISADGKKLALVATKEKA